MSFIPDALLGVILVASVDDASLGGNCVFQSFFSFFFLPFIFGKGLHMIDD